MEEKVCEDLTSHNFYNQTTSTLYVHNITLLYTVVHGRSLKRTTTRGYVSVRVTATNTIDTTKSEVPNLRSASRTYKI